ncbi:MAG: hypothetical protein B0D92_06120 [Spirochaeta sp. LUC14_002_19_P3]|nr:MAG: hypothetical protein B0D92_06120 [Spirochaeta sp. LUC14_002_19_P3]
MDALIEFIIEPFTHTFMVRGLIGGLLTAVACASLSAFVVWRGMSFMGDALAHAVLPGIAIAYAAGFSLFLGALGAAAAAAAAMGLFAWQNRLKEDAAIGVVFVGFFALGLVILSRIAAYSDLGHILFGNILGISTGDLILIAAVTLAIVATLSLCFKELITASFDPAHAMSIGLSPELVRGLLLALIALAAVTAIQTVGAVLVLALLVTPGAAAAQITRRLSVSLLLAAGMASIATLLGLYISYYTDTPSGGVIVLVLTGMFCLCAGIAAVCRTSL